MVVGAASDVSSLLGALRTRLLRGISKVVARWIVDSICKGCTYKLNPKVILSLINQWLPVKMETPFKLLTYTKWSAHITKMEYGKWSFHRVTEQALKQRAHPAAFGRQNSLTAPLSIIKKENSFAKIVFKKIKVFLSLLLLTIFSANLRHKLHLTIVKTTKQ